MKVPRSSATAFLLAVAFGPVRAADEPPVITFNANFEGGSLGTVEKVGDAKFRVRVLGQQDEYGRNRAAHWYYFRMDGVKDRDLTLTLTDLVGEYNGRPVDGPIGPGIHSVYSTDGDRWQHFPNMTWDGEKKEATVTLRPDADTLWVAHAPPYVPSRLHKLLAELDKFPHAFVEVAGKSAQGRDLSMLTVTDPDVPDDRKKKVWLIARQHAWETGTSYAAEGAMRFVASDEARDLRKRVVFRFLPMLNPDACATGKPRFNANGYDPNRHWDVLDVRRKEFLTKLPEAWYARKALLADHTRERPIDLAINLHNTERTEYVSVRADDGPALAKFQRLFEVLAADTTFDPTDKQVRVSHDTPDTASALLQERGVPIALMEQRISAGKKLGRQPTADDRLTFGRQLVAAMADTVAR